MAYTLILAGLIGFCNIVLLVYLHVQFLELHALLNKNRKDNQ